MPTVVSLAAIALALASCTVETRYVPRTPHRLALGMRNREPGFYLDGKFIKLSEADVALAACSPSASADLTQAVIHQGSFQSNNIVGMVFNAVAPLAFVLAGPIYYPPAFGIGLFFGIRADGKRQQSYAEVVDAINRYNDDPRCAP